MKIGSRVIHSGSSKGTSRTPTWNGNGVKAIGTVTYLLEIKNKIKYMKVYWDTQSCTGRSTEYAGTNLGMIVEIRPLMIPIGTLVVLKDYTGFGDTCGKVGEVILRSTRLGVKVKIGKVENYVPVENIILSNGVTAPCARCGHDVVISNKDSKFKDGYFLHSHCLDRCRNCGEDADNISCATVHPYNYMCEDCGENCYINCSDCGRICYYEDVINLSSGDSVCSGCASNKVDTCPHCGRYEYIEKFSPLSSGKKVCIMCKSMVKNCSHCGKEDFRFHHYEDKHFCEDCISIVLASCSRCGEWTLKENRVDFTLRDEVFKGICPKCKLQLEESLYIFKYNYKPSRFYYSKMKYEKNPLYLGMELEVETPKTTSLDSAKETLEKIKDLGVDKYFYLKSDGSLMRGHSFELVGQPATLAYIGNTYRVYDLLDFFIKQGYDCTSTGNCGLHVHVSNKDLSFNDIAKIKMFIWKHKNLLRLFGNKTKRGEEKYAPFEKYEFRDFKTKRMVNWEHTKYIACNLTKSTLEFRFWGATFEHLKLLSMLSFSEAIVYYAKDMSLAKAINGSFAEFVDWLNKSNYFHLVKYFNLLDLINVEKKGIVTSNRIIDASTSEEDANTVQEGRVRTPAFRNVTPAFRNVTPAFRNVAPPRPNRVVSFESIID